jgi:ABC-type nickel/cobalt efflux system permease component RcnA
VLESIIAGLAAGAVHVLAGPDHLAAVAPLAADGRDRPWRTGLMWGAGHASGVLLVGLGALLLREVLPVDALAGWSERLVGVVLIGIGAWGISRAVRQRVHRHAHAHGGTRHEHVHVHVAAGVPLAPASAGVDSPVPGPGSIGTAVAHGHLHPATTRAALAVGVLHGLAGSAHFLGVLPALALPTRTEAVAYVAAFGVGTIAAMTVFAEAIGRVAATSASRGTRLYRGLLAVLGGIAIIVGVAWLLG